MSKTFGYIGVVVFILGVAGFLFNDYFQKLFPTMSEFWNVSGFLVVLSFYLVFSSIEDKSVKDSVLFWIGFALSGFGILVYKSAYVSDSLLGLSDKNIILVAFILVGLSVPFLFLSLKRFFFHPLSVVSAGRSEKAVETGIQKSKMRTEAKENIKKAKYEEVKSTEKDLVIALQALFEAEEKSLRSLEQKVDDLNSVVDSFSSTDDEFKNTLRPQFVALFAEVMNISSTSFREKGFVKKFLNKSKLLAKGGF